MVAKSMSNACYSLDLIDKVLIVPQFNKSKAILVLLFVRRIKSSR